MQLKSFFSEEEIRQHDNPLLLTFYPIEKLKVVATAIANESCKQDFAGFAISEMIKDAAKEIDFLVNVANDRLNKVEDLDNSDENNPNSAFFLSEISAHDAKKLLEFMHLHLPGCKQLNPGMTWEESNEMGKLFEKVRAVLYCLARESHDNVEQIKKEGAKS